MVADTQKTISLVSTGLEALLTLFKHADWAGTVQQEAQIAQAVVAHPDPGLIMAGIFAGLQGFGVKF